MYINGDSKYGTDAVFDERGQIRDKIDVDSEIEALRSPQLLQEVVKRLNLHINYKINGIKKVDLYAQSPVFVLFLNSIEQEPISFQLDIISDSIVQLSNFVLGEIKISQTIRTGLNEETSTPVGNIVILPTRHYSTEMQLPLEISKSRIINIAMFYARSLKVSLASRKKTMIHLTLEDVSQQRAEDFLNTLISVYNENWLSEKNQPVIATLRLLNEKIEAAKKDLDEIDDSLELFKRQYSVIDIRDAGWQARKEFSEYSGRAQVVQNQISVAKLIQKDLKDVNKRWELLPSNLVLNHQAIESSISLHNDLIQKRNRLIVDSGEKNPVLVELSNQISSLRQTILQTVDKLITTSNTQLRNLRSQAQKMSAQIDSYPEQERELQSLEREQSAKNDLYLYLLRQREENEMALLTAKTKSRLNGIPSGSSAPVKPQKYQIFLIAFIAGMGVPCSIIWGWNVVSPAVRGKIDLNNFPVQSLGTIPSVRITDPEKDMIQVHGHGRGAINEAFRIVRTKLDRTCKPVLKVILFTSMEPGSGKTFVTANIAKSFALAGKKIILLDLDMRTASLSKFINSPESGIANFLNNPKDRLFIADSDSYDGFDIIPVGAIPPNPSELLMSDHLESLIGDLKAEYDYVFIDCTSVDLVTDALIVEQYADLSVFVLRENCTNKRKLNELVNIFHSGEFKNMRVILNGQPLKKYYNAYYDEVSKPKLKESAVFNNEVCFLPNNRGHNTGTSNSSL